MRALDALERSQKKLYLALKSELALFEKRKTKELLDYERAFRRSLPSKPKVIKKAEFLRAIKRSNVVLVGDFHPFRQSQKGFVRLLEECAPFFPRVVVALECFQQGHQCALNEFLGNLLTIEELREKIDFERHWPFPWENYREILLRAKARGFRVIALNVLDKNRGGPALKNRDRAAAARIAAEIHDSRTAVFGLYGELHLARPHLPAEIRERSGRAARVTIVHQNEPGLYWKSPKLRSGQKPELLRLARDEYCIQNSVPWIKLRSYLDWLEGSPNSVECDEAMDYAGLVHQYASLLAEAIDLPVQLRDNLEIVGPRELDKKRPLALRKVAPAERSLLQHSLLFQRTGYLASAAVITLPGLSTNALSEAASYLLWHSRATPGSLPIPSEGPDDWMAHFFLGYLGSKVLNPKRKCNEVKDLRFLLLNLARGNGTKKASKTSVIARALTLLGPYLRDQKTLPRIRPLVGAREVEACRLAGFVLAERFFTSLLRDPSLLTVLRGWYVAPALSGERLADAASKIARSPAASKHDLY